MKLTQGIRRKLIQIAAFGFTNAHLTNFGKGKIYTGKWKNFCVPGLNCYSCPAASAACPIGALQAVQGSMDFNLSFYVLGFLLAVGVIFGRAVCGFACPFGLLQELLNKIPSKKRRLPAWTKYIKYAVLAVFVMILPVAVTDYMGIGKPAFCEFICPAGLLEGALPLMAAHPELRSAIGPVFWIKVSVCVIVILGSAVFHRFFCKVLCPLGAIYGLLNKISFYRLHLSTDKCVHCGKCARVCPMDVDPVRNPSSAECIRCGACAAVCPKAALRLGFRGEHKVEPGC